MVKKILFFLFLCLAIGCSDSDDNQDPNSEIENPPEPSWRMLWPPPELETDMKGFLVSDENPDEIIVFCDSLESVEDDGIEIYASVDGGKNWTASTVIHDQYASFYGERIVEVLKNGKDLSDLYIVTTHYYCAHNTCLLAPKYRLRRYHADTLTTEIVVEGTKARFEIITDWEDESVMYVSESGMGGAGGPSALLRSRDGGASFQNIGEFFPRFWANETDETTIGCDMRLLDAHPDGTLAVFCDQLYFSYDEGDTWQEIIIEEDGDTSFPYDLMFSLSSPKRAYLFDEASQRLRRFDVDTGEWEELSLPDETKTIALSPDAADKIFAAAGYSGVFVSEDGGFTWDNLGEELNEMLTKSVQLSGDSVFAETDQGIFVYP